MLSSSVPENRNVSWRTMPICERSELKVTSRDVVPVHRHPPCRHVVEAAQEVNNARLTRTGGSHERHHLAGLDVQIDSTEAGRPGLYSKVTPSKRPRPSICGSWYASGFSATVGLVSRN